MRASEHIRRAVLAWGGVTEEPHRFGGVEFRLGKRELGHLHGDVLVDIPFPMNVRNELVTARRVDPHHILPESGWISFRIEKEKDVLEAVALLRHSFDLAVEAKKKKEKN